MMSTPAPGPDEEMMAMGIHPDDLEQVPMGVDPHGNDLHRPAPAGPPLRCWCGGLVGQYNDVSYCSDSKFHDPLATGRPTQVNMLYVAGPMSGYPECNYPAFHSATALLRAAGYTVVNPADFGNGAHYVDFLREDLRLMLDCDAVATLEGWWESVGARNEVQVAGLLKMPVRSVVDWLERAALELRDQALQGHGQA